MKFIYVMGILDICVGSIATWFAVSEKDSLFQILGFGLIWLGFFVIRLGKKVEHRDKWKEKKS